MEQHRDVSLLIEVTSKANSTSDTTTFNFDLSFGTTKKFRGYKCDVPCNLYAGRTFRVGITLKNTEIIILENVIAIPSCAKVIIPSWVITL